MNGNAAFQDWAAAFPSGGRPRRPEPAEPARLPDPEPASTSDGDVFLWESWTPWGMTAEEVDYEW